MTQSEHVLRARRHAVSDACTCKHCLRAARATGARLTCKARRCWLHLRASPAQQLRASSPQRASRQDGRAASGYTHAPFRRQQSGHRSGTHTRSNSGLARRHVKIKRWACAARPRTAPLVCAPEALSRTALMSSRSTSWQGVDCGRAVAGVSVSAALRHATRCAPGAACAWCRSTHARSGPIAHHVRQRGAALRRRAAAQSGRRDSALAPAAPPTRAAPARSRRRPRPWRPHGPGGSAAPARVRPSDEAARRSLRHIAKQPCAATAL